MRGTRRFSQAVSEGDGISVIADVSDADAARLAESDGAEAVVVRGELVGVREATELPILWCANGPLSDAVRAGADACLLVVERERGDADRLEALHGEALELGLDCVVEVRSEEELELALARLDPDIFLLAAGGDGDAIERALELLPDVPAGKLAVAEVAATTRDRIAELERAGVDGVIVEAQDVADLVGAGPPEV